MVRPAVLPKAPQRRSLLTGKRSRVVCTLYLIICSALDESVFHDPCFTAVHLVSGESPGVLDTLYWKVLTDITGYFGTLWLLALLCMAFHTQF